MKRYNQKNKDYSLHKYLHHFISKLRNKLHPIYKRSIKSLKNLNNIHYIIKRNEHLYIPYINKCIRKEFSYKLFHSKRF